MGRYFSTIKNRSSEQTADSKKRVERRICRFPWKIVFPTGKRLRSTEQVWKTFGLINSNMVPKFPRKGDQTTAESKTTTPVTRPIKIFLLSGRLGFKFIEYIVDDQCGAAIDSRSHTAHNCSQQGRHHEPFQSDRQLTGLSLPAGHFWCHSLFLAETKQRLKSLE